jgi:hypothetical protein
MRFPVPVAGRDMPRLLKKNDKPRRYRKAMKEGIFHAFRPQGQQRIGST